MYEVPHKRWQLLIIIVVAITLLHFEFKILNFEFNGHCASGGSGNKIVFFIILCIREYNLDGFACIDNEIVRANFVTICTDYSIRGNDSNQRPDRGDSYRSRLWRRLLSKSTWIQNNKLKN